jgi:hypothetical protein
MRSRIVRGTLFSLSLSFVGLIVGTAVGIQLVPPGSGLAGAAIALGYGIIGMFVGLLLGVVLSRKLSRTGLHIGLFVAGGITLAAFAWMTWRYHVTRDERPSAPATQAQPAAPDR